MRARIRNAVAVVVLTAAVAATGVGCGSSDDPSGDGGRTPAAGAADAAPGPSPTGGTEKPDGPAGPSRNPAGENGGGAEALPKVPKAELTPATGSFTEKQKEYLVDRVPKGTDPAAVLEAGKAVCDRITRTAKVDRKAAVSALRSGEIAHAEAAVTHLCPQHEPLLEAAGLTG